MINRIAGRELKKVLKLCVGNIFTAFISDKCSIYIEKMMMGHPIVTASIKRGARGCGRGKKRGHGEFSRSGRGGMLGGDEEIEDGERSSKRAKTDKDKDNEEYLEDPRTLRSYLESLNIDRLIERFRKFMDDELMDILPPSKVREFDQMVRALQEKRDKFTEYKKKKAHGNIEYPYTPGEFHDRLRGPAELAHPWMPTLETCVPGGHLIRLWDDQSQCKVADHAVGFLSGGNHAPLTTEDERQSELRRHTNWGNKEKTAFISMTPYINEVDQVYLPAALKRQRSSTKKENSTIRITMVNANKRIADGYPIIWMKTALEYYKFHIPGTCTREHFDKEWLLPWRVRPEEIVATWCLKDIEVWMRDHNGNLEKWYQMVAKPAFEAHEAARLEGRVVESQTGCTCCGHAEKK